VSALQLDDIYAGKKFGSAVVLYLTRRGKDRAAECRCNCGKSFTTTLTRIRCGHVNSCASCASKAAWKNVKRLAPEELFLRRKERHYKRDAVRKNRVWLLGTFEFRELLNKACNYCGLPEADGIDRLDNVQGYTPANSVPCCSQCNYAKRDMPVDEFLLWVSRIALKQGFTK